MTLQREKHQDCQTTKHVTGCRSAAGTAMKYLTCFSVLLLGTILLGACTEELDPLSLGTTVGQYAIGAKALVPLALGNRWTYDVTVYDTSGAERTHYTYSLSVVDSATADTSLIPLVPPSTDRRRLSRTALLWYHLRGELGVVMSWQIDSLENLRMRSGDDSRFYQQTEFDFRASIGGESPARFIDADTSLWTSGDTLISGPDSVHSTLVSKGADTLRTTLGTAPYFQYRRSYATGTDYADYAFKPGFGLVLVEYFRKTAGGSMVCIRRDRLQSYFFQP